MVVDDFVRALVNAGVITEAQLAVAMESEKNQGKSLRDVLIEKGFITEKQYLESAAKKMKTDFVSLDEIEIDNETAEMLPGPIARKHLILPLKAEKGKVVVATSKPIGLAALDDIKGHISKDIKPVFTTESELQNAINKFYRGREVTEVSKHSDVKIITDDDETSMDYTPEKLEKVAWGEKIVATVSNIISQAYHDRASDIHIEPTRHDVGVRLRIDGFLEELTRLPRNMHLPLISRIKVVSNMDVAERRKPQDGRVRMEISGKEIDMRIATYPTMFGEAVAIRLLTKDQLITLEKLGFLANDLKIFSDIIMKPHGIFLVTGPTGSGKSTTLYAALMEINSKEKHILSIEDPVEHEIPNIDQQQVNVKAGMTFATALRAMLREDPDVIMVGEIRDQETAEIAVRAAMTGHLVFSTLHTNTSLATISRLVDLGVEPYLVGSTLVGVMAQRLVRRVCDKCKVETTMPKEIADKFGSKAELIHKIYKGSGCDHCRNTGYFGRIGLFEIVPVNEDVRILINKMMPEVRIREKVIALGFHTIMEDGIEKINTGYTTPEEVIRVTST